MDDCSRQDPAYRPAKERPRPRRGLSTSSVLITGPPEHVRRTRSGQNRLAISAVPTFGRSVRLAPARARIYRHHLSPAEQAGDRMAGGESLPNPDEMLIKGWLAAQVPEPRWGQGQSAH